MRAGLIVAPAAAAVVAATPTGVVAETAPPPSRFHGLTAREWAGKFHAQRRQLHQTRMLLRRRWRPTVTYALRLASAVSGVSYWDMRSVAWCESRLDPFATNGRYRGLFQLGWDPFGLDPYEPLANSISAGLTVRHDGGWGQWECKP